MKARFRVLGRLDRCPACGYYGFNGEECFDCGYHA
jgi:rRNA maturation protein Nop10